jgi:hypothetical protein
MLEYCRVRMQPPQCVGLRCIAAIRAVLSRVSVQVRAAAIEYLELPWFAIINGPQIVPAVQRL